MTSPIARAVMLVSAILPVAVRAQAGELSAGLAGMVPVPVGPLVDSRSVGVGATASLRYTSSTPSALGIRVELTGLPTSTHANPPGNRVATVTNGSSALVAGIGPQVGMAFGPGRFYTTATGGVARLWATSAAAGYATPGGSPPFNTYTATPATNFAWSAGGGYVLPLSAGRSRLSADIGLRYYDLGRATYVTRYPAELVVGGGISGLYSPTAASTTGHHRTTFVAPSIGLTWHY